MIKIIMIEDDVEMAELISEFLSLHNIHVTNYDTPEIGLSALNVEHYDLLILDLSLPNIDGLEVCRLVREKMDIPIIISSARSDIEDKTACFYMGADDYLPKPYESKELLLRIHSVLRRYNKEPAVEEKTLTFTVDEDRHEIRKEGELIYFTNAEFEIMAYFIKRKGFVVSREEILSNVDAINYESSLKSIDVMIGRLRAKIEESPKQPKYIISLRGMGYKLINE
ncbi:response regulator transcription factor [Sulfurovum sp.]|uniref:response regulator transcription factor n=1 Tax=Sulfurovum sp. TaxID=1969726 RepID=UPI002867FD4C|nr:response regulator transcription factor [Sulfurovum sp.]